MKPLRVAIAGYGKIAADQHHPSIDRDDRFELAATVDSKPTDTAGVEAFRRVSDMLGALEDVDAVAVCTPPSVRHDIARGYIEAGLHVLLEKPPG